MMDDDSALLPLDQRIKLPLLYFLKHVKQAMQTNYDPYNQTHVQMLQNCTRTH